MHSPQKGNLGVSMNDTLKFPAEGNLPSLPSPKVFFITFPIPVIF